MTYYGNNNHIEKIKTENKISQTINSLNFINFVLKIPRILFKKITHCKAYLY